MPEKVFYNEYVNQLYVRLDSRDALGRRTMKNLHGTKFKKRHEMEYGEYAGSDGVHYSLKVGNLGSFSWDMFDPDYLCANGKTKKIAIKNARKLLDGFGIGNKEIYHKTLDDFCKQLEQKSDRKQ